MDLTVNLKQFKNYWKRNCTIHIFHTCIIMLKLAPAYLEIKLIVGDFSCDQSSSTKLLNTTEDGENKQFDGKRFAIKMYTYIYFLF